MSERYEIDVLVWDEDGEEPVLKGTTVYTGCLESVKEWIRKRIYINVTGDHLLPAPTVALEHYKRAMQRAREAESEIMDWQRTTGRAKP